MKAPWRAGNSTPPARTVCTTLPFFQQEIHIFFFWKIIILSPPKKIILKMDDHLPPVIPLTCCLRFCSPGVPRRLNGFLMKLHFPNVEDRALSQTSSSLTKGIRNATFWSNKKGLPWMGSSDILDVWNFRFFSPVYGVLSWRLVFRYDRLRFSNAAIDTFPIQHLAPVLKKQGVGGWSQLLRSIILKKRNNKFWSQTMKRKMVGWVKSKVWDK